LEVAYIKHIPDQFERVLYKALFGKPEFFIFKKLSTASIFTNLFYHC